MPDPTEVLYFAYGSNLNRADWARYCERHGDNPDGLQPLARAILPDMRLVFDYVSASRGGGVLNLRPAVGHIVHGVLFRADDCGWSTLDAKEGAPHCYQRVSRIALAEDGARVPVVTYEVIPACRTDFARPTPEYRAIVAQGLEDWDLPVDPLERAATNQAPRAAIDTLFVYGTLMQGESRSAIIPCDQLLDVSPGVTAGTLYETAGDYPAMRLPDPQPGPDRGWVRGECLRLAALPELLPRLDRIEGFGGYDDPWSLFHRTLVPVYPDDGHTRLAWCYVAAESGLLGDCIAGGCWRTHCQGQDAAS